jgi:AcrR family transcriptional regulator
VDDSISSPERSDGRRLAGAQTRRRLLDAAAEILAEHGEPGLTLRALTALAGSNVATVKYHFGSRDALVDEVISAATQSVVGAQIAALDALVQREPSPSAQAWIAAWATPLVRVAISRHPGDRRLGRIISQSHARPDGRLESRFKDATAAPTQRLRDGLGRALPHLDSREVTLRVALMFSALAGLASGAFDAFIVEADPAADLQTRIIDRLVTVTTA